MQFPSLFLEHTICKPLFESVSDPFEVLPRIHSFILEFAKNKHLDYLEISPLVSVHKSVCVPSNVTIVGPAIIGEGTILRPNAYIRNDVIIGKNCVIGNSTEIKNSILFDNVEVPHFNYIGDSVLGYHAHFGAGAITSNFKQDGSMIVLKDNQEKLETGLRKMGAIVGDFVEVGCNVILNPGTIVGERSRIYPLLSIRGNVPRNVIVKEKDLFVPIK